MAVQRRARVPITALFEKLEDGLRVNDSFSRGTGASPYGRL
jgi:hypothetical protein